ncbi:MAG: hypothetical protein KBB57_12645 [Amaricoccus sp.]|nr:hypothetical protein [Amaricoccus sp.]
MRTRVILAAVVACTVVAAIPAGAASLRAVYAGVITDSRNRTGEFGRTGLYSLDGLRAVFTFTYNLAGTSSRTYVKPDGTVRTEVSGGTGDYFPGNPSPIVRAQVRINGVTERLPVDYLGTAVGSEKLRVFSTRYYNSARDDVRQIVAGSDPFAASIRYPADLEAEIPLTELAGMPPEGYFLFQRECRISHCAPDGRFARGFVDLDSLQVAAVVPLPPAILLLGTGLGGLAWLGPATARRLTPARPLRGGRDAAQ